ncbi:hypothetical protein QG37_03261 [Candidozyma auris]|nr:hypothetical protein QG37_03261 [[Candida] auris]
MIIVSFPFINSMILEESSFFFKKNFYFALLSFKAKGE